MLYRLSAQSYRRRGVFLSAMVVTGDTGQPGGGFFNGMIFPLTGQNVPEADRRRFWEAARNDVYRAYSE